MDELLDHGNDVPDCTRCGNYEQVPGYGGLCFECARNDQDGATEASMAKQEVGEVKQAPTGILAAIEEATTTDAALAAFKAAPPPTNRLDQQALREALFARLREKKLFHSPTKVIDAWLASAEPDAEAGQGTAFTVEELVPWDHPVDGAQLLDELEGFYRKFVVATDDQILAVALWTMHTYALDAFYISPFLCFTSPTPRCGKSTFLELVDALSYRSIAAGNLTTATVFRTIEKFQPTLCIDEIDNVAKNNDEIRGILNSSHRRKLAFVLRCVGDNQEIRRFSTWAPKVVTLLRSVSDQFDDRSIIVKMAMKPRGVSIEDPDPEFVDPLAEPLRRKMYRCALEHAAEFGQYRVPRETGLDLRVRDNWTPLLSIASVCGFETLERAITAALALSAAADSNIHYRTLLLAHVRDAFGEADRITTADLLAHLVDRDDGPWAKWWGNDVEGGRLKGPGSRLARELRAFGIRSKKIWLPAQQKSVQGFEREDFEADWERYTQTQPTPSPESEDSEDSEGSTSEGVSDGASTSSLPTLPTLPSSGGGSGVSLSDDLLDLIQARDVAARGNLFEVARSLNRDAIAPPDGKYWTAFKLSEFLGREE